MDVSKTLELEFAGGLNEHAPEVKTILVVDDNEDDIKIMRLMFQRSRILNPLKSVNTVEDAVCYLKGAGKYSDRALFPFPTLIFVDLHLPDGSGFDVLRWMRSQYAASPMGVVVLSGSDLNAFKEAYKLGAHSFLVKPISFDDFEATVTHLRGLKLTSCPAGYVVDRE